MLPTSKILLSEISKRSHRYNSQPQSDLMNVVIFLGSGILRPMWEYSEASEDIPDVVEIMRSLLLGLWKRQEEIFVS